MRGWSSTLHQAAHKVMDELAAVDPHNTSLAFARSVFAEAEQEGVKPSGRPPSGRSAAARERRAAKEAGDREAAALYESGLSMMETAKRLDRSVGYVDAALRRLGIERRSTGSGRGVGVDQMRVTRIRTMREAGSTLEEIGAAERITRERVRQICAANGIEHGHNPELDERQLAAVHEYLTGASLEVVARQYDVSTHGLKNWIMRAGHVPRPQGGKAREFNPETLARAERAATLYRRGLKGTEIAAELGLANPAMIYRLLAIHGVEPTRHPRRVA